MTTPALKGVDNMPRDFDALAKEERFVLFRVALKLGADEAFTSQPHADQVNSLLAMLLRHDDPAQPCPCNVCAAGAGAPPQQGMPQVAPQPMAAAPMGQPVTPTMMGQPQVVAPGQPAVPQPAFAPPAFAPQAQQQGMPPQAPPPQAPTPQTAQQPGLPPRTAVVAPEDAPAAGPSPVQKLLKDVSSQQKKILKELESCAGVGETEELKEIVLGMARMMNVMCVVQLDIAAAQLDMPKEAIIALATGALQQGEPEKFFKPTDEAEGN